MNRGDFLKGLGIAGVASVLPFKHMFAGTPDPLSTCTLMPTEEVGPFPYPGGELSNPLNRVDVTGGQTGIPLQLTFNIVTTSSCTPVAGARVDIWHCNREGWYSGYDGQSGGLTGTSANHAGETWLRGYQITDGAGKAQFTTIYPGWYMGRATHIHVEVFIGGVLYKAGQVAFPEAISNAVHVSSLYAAHGVNTTGNSGDSVFSNSATDLANETLSPVGNTTAGYTATFNFGIDYTVSAVDETIVTGREISIYPNPAIDKIVVSHPVVDARTTIKVFSLDGRQVAAGNLQIGATVTNVDISRISAGMYLLVIQNGAGRNAVKFVKN